MNTAMDNQGGVNTAGPLKDLTNNDASHGLLNVIVVSDDDGVHNRGRHAYEASRTTTTNENSPSAAHPGRTNHKEQLTTTTSMMLTDMSAATDMRLRAVPNNDDERVHEDNVVTTTMRHKQQVARPSPRIDLATMGTTSVDRSFAARTGPARIQQLVDQAYNDPTTTARHRQIADPIDGSARSNENPATPRIQSTTSNSTMNHAMNFATAPEWQHGPSTMRQYNGIITKIAMMAPDETAVHDTKVNVTSRRIDAHTSYDDDGNAGTTTCAQPSTIQYNKTCGILTATLRAGIDHVSRNNNENVWPRLQLTTSRSGGSVWSFVVSGDGFLTSVDPFISQASTELHQIVVDPILLRAYGKLAAVILIAPRRCPNESEALDVKRDSVQRRGKALSNWKPLDRGRHFGLEAKMSKPAFHPRALAIIIANVQGVFCRTLRQQGQVPFGTRLQPERPEAHGQPHCSCCSTLLCSCFLDLPAYAPHRTSPGALLPPHRGVDVCVRRLSCLRACGVSLCVWRDPTAGDVSGVRCGLGGKAPDGELLWSHIRASLMH